MHNVHVTFTSFSLNAVLLSGWQRAKNETGDNEMTCDRPDNAYTVSSALARHPSGIRLDYVMYRANAGEYSVSSESCRLFNSAR